MGGKMRDKKIEKTMEEDVYDEEDIELDEEEYEEELDE
jgi:hypothetical protein